MNKAFCQCGRECEWPESHDYALCRCSRTVEPQTDMERADTRQMHEARLQRIYDASPFHFRLKG